MREWDPIGVADVPECQDEYDNYVAKAYVMLMDEGADSARIAAYLLDIAQNYMGVFSPTLPERSRRTAEALVAMRLGSISSVEGFPCGRRTNVSPAAALASPKSQRTDVLPASRCSKQTSPACKIFSARENCRTSIFEDISD
jgi:hypothetical protein